MFRFGTSLTLHNTAIVLQFFPFTLSVKPNGFVVHVHYYRMVCHERKIDYFCNWVWSVFQISDFFWKVDKAKKKKYLYFIILWKYLIHFTFFLATKCVLVCFLSRTHGDLVSGLYHQILLSLQKVLSDPVRPLCSHYGAVVGLHALGWKVCFLITSGYLCYLCLCFSPNVSWFKLKRCGTSLYLHSRPFHSDFGWLLELLCSSKWTWFHTSHFT